MRDLFGDRVFTVIVVISMIGVASVVVLGVDAGTSYKGTGTVVNFTVVSRSGNFSNYSGTISTPHGPFAFTMTCLHLSTGAQVQYEHDFIDGYVLVGDLPDNCTTI